MAADTTQGTGLGAAQTTRGPDGGNRSFYANVDVLKKLNNFPQVTVSGNYTLQLSDVGKHLYVGGAHTITVPLNSVVPFEVGSTITLVTAGSDVAIAKANNSTIIMYGWDGTNGTDSDSWVVEARTLATLLKVNQDTWHLSGDGIFID